MPSRRRASAASRPCSTSTTSPTRPTSSTSPPAASPERSPTASAADGRTALRRRLDRSRHEAAESRAHRLRRPARLVRGAGRRAPRRRRRPVRHRDVHGPPPGQGGDDRLPAGDEVGGPAVPLQVQVTMETTGRMLVGSEIGAALVSLGAMRPDVLGINCATGPAEMQEHLRFLSRHSPLPISVLPNAGLPSVVDGRTHYDLSPEDLAEYHRRHVTELGVSIVGGCCGTTPEHLRRVVEAVGGVSPAPRSPSFEPSVASIYSPVAARPGPQRADDRRAHQRQRVQGVPRRDAGGRLGLVREDGQRADQGGRPRPRRLRRLRRPRRHRRHGRDRQALRHAVQRPARHRLHRAAGRRGGAHPHRRAGDPQLGEPRGRRAAREPDGPGVLARPRLRARR